MSNPYIKDKHYIELKEKVEQEHRKEVEALTRLVTYPINLSLIHIELSVKGKKHTRGSLTHIPKVSPDIRLNWEQKIELVTRVRDIYDRGCTQSFKALHMELLQNEYVRFIARNDYELATAITVAVLKNTTGF